MAPRVLFTGGGTGGHLYPALNIADAVRRLEPSAECFFVGSRRGIESRVLPESGWDYRLLPLEPIRRSKPWQNWKLLATTPAVVAGVSAVFKSFRPDVVVGTGGYVSGATLWWASRKGVPIVLQEQNAEPGLVTRRLASRAAQIHLGYPEALGRLEVGARTDVFDSGNPVASVDTPVAPRDTPADSADTPIAAAETAMAAAHYSGSSDRYDWPRGRVLLVVGGSQGAKGINDRLTADLTGGGEVPGDVTIVWVAGPKNAATVREALEELPTEDRIRVVPFIDDLGRQLEAVDLAVSRAGAMLVAELCAAGVPSVLVPLPTAAANHQVINANALAEAGAAESREEKTLGPGDLWSACLELLGDDERLGRMSEAARERARPNAARDIARAVLDLVGERVAA